MRDKKYSTFRAALLHISLSRGWKVTVNPLSASRGRRKRRHAKQFWGSAIFGIFFPFLWGKKIGERKSGIRAWGII